MAITRVLQMNVHNVASIRIERGHAEGTTTCWTNVLIRDSDDNEYEITCFGTPEVVNDAGPAPKEEAAKEAP